MSQYQLSSQQQDILNFVENNNNNLMIEAGPGSGKTFMLKELVYQNTGKRILAICFNNSIKDELQKAVGKLAIVLTFHQLGNSLCNANKTGKFKWIDALHNPKKGGSPENKYKFIIKKILKDNNEHFSLLDEVKTIANYIRITNSDLKNVQAIMEMLAFYNIPYSDPNSIQLAIQAIYEGIDAFKQYQHVDFTDMLYLPNKLNMEVKLGMQLGGKDDNFVLPKLDLILVDETQDQSDTMANILCKYLFPNTKIIAVGDKMQSINGFAGSLPNSMDNLIQQFNMTTLPLSITYRCPSNHVNYVNNIFGTSLTAFNNGGNIDNISFDRMTDQLVYGDLVIGRKQNSKDALLIPLFHSLLRSGKNCTLLGIDLLFSVTKHLDEINTDNWNNVFDSFLDYQTEIRQFFIEKGWKNKLADFDDECYLVNIMLEYADLHNINSYEAFKNALKSFSYEKANSIILSTCHKAKGREATNIYLLNASEFPYTKETNLDWQNTQESNLWYVSLTRSKQNLFLVN